MLFFEILEHGYWSDAKISSPPGRLADLFQKVSLVI
tara:strand:- start:158 stop:265 length:108 start_codon:yes stop_codon:yes gene_type:complete